tara:strand:+ start:412 stop:1125 length:714 start_codon:yes stop_codon:yes gene_type:complete
MNTVDNFRGAVHSGDTAVDLYFDAAGSGVAGAFDKIPLVVVTEKEQEVMEFIGGALAGTHSKGMVVIADDVASKYVNANITSVGAFSLASTGVLAKANIHDLVTADTVLTPEESGKTFIFTDAAAILTLPDSGGGDIIGTTYRFISNFQGTGQEVICADTTGEKIIGALVVADTDDITSAGTFTAEAGDSFSSVEITGTTEGELGSMWTMTNIQTDVWFIEGTMLSAGTSATPFATS